MQKVAPKVAITFVKRDHKEKSKERYEKMFEEYYTKLENNRYVYDQSIKKRQREREIYNEKFEIEWIKMHQPSLDIKMPTVEPFIGPHNQTFVWEDSDGYTVYSNKSKEEAMKLKIAELRNNAKLKRLAIQMHSKQL